MRKAVGVWARKRPLIPHSAPLCVAQRSSHMGGNVHAHVYARRGLAVVIIVEAEAV